MCPAGQSCACPKWAVHNSLTARKSSGIVFSNCGSLATTLIVISKRKVGWQMPVSLRHIIIPADSSVSASFFCETTEKKRLLASRSDFVKAMRTSPPLKHTLKKGRKHCQRAPKNVYKLCRMIKVSSRLCKCPL